MTSTCIPDQMEKFHFPAYVSALVLVTESRFSLIAHHVVVSPFASRIREHTFQQTHTYVLAPVAKGFLVFF